MHVIDTYVHIEYTLHGKKTKFKGKLAPIFNFIVGVKRQTKFTLHWQFFTVTT